MDWIVSDFLAIRQGSLGRLRYILKNGLKYLPLYGFYFAQVTVLPQKSVSVPIILCRGFLKGLLQLWILYIMLYYSTNYNTIQIWSWCSWYLSSTGNRYPAIYIALHVGRKSEVKKCRQKDLKNVTSFVINLLNNKTIILLNLAEYHLILADSAYGLVG